MNRLIVDLLYLAGGGVLLLLECLHEIHRPLGDGYGDSQYALCAQCARRHAEREAAALSAQYARRVTA